LNEFMRVQRLRLAVLLLSGLLSACGPAPAATTNSATATTSPSALATPASGYRVLFTASTGNGSEIFLYDSASNAPQQLVSVGNGAPEARFITSDKIAYVDTNNQGSSRIMVFDLTTRAASVVVSAVSSIPAVAYKHDGSGYAYLQHDSAGKASLVVSNSGRPATYRLNDVVGRGVGRDDEVRLEYAPDDKYLLMIDTFLGNQAQAPETGQFLVLRAADNTVAFLPPSGISANATMATWARHSDRLYYRDAVGVRTWDAGVTSVGTLATALHWYDPAPSADDRWLAFTDIDTQFVPHVRLYDVQTKQVAATVITPRSHPIFVSTDTVWYLEEQACQGECMGGPSQPSGKVRAYSLTSKGETTLPFSDVHSLSQLSVFSR
jgi:Tol biopolymer transport system component